MEHVEKGKNKIRELQSLRIPSSSTSNEIDYRDNVSSIPQKRKQHFEGESADLRKVKLPNSKTLIESKRRTG
jgi:hypothetical protein